MVVLAILSIAGERAAHPGQRPVVTALAVGRPIAAIAAAIGIGVALNPRLASGTLTLAIALGLAGFILSTAAELLQENHARSRASRLVDLLLPVAAMVAFYGLLAGGPLVPVALIALVVLAVIIYWRDPRRALGRGRA